MEKINHFIMNTGQVMQYENDMEVIGEFKDIFSTIDLQAEGWQKISALDGTEVKCIIGRKQMAYKAELYLKNPEGIPLLTTIGVADIDAAGKKLVDNMWETMTDIYSPLCKVSVIPGIPATSEIPSKCLETPFICDVLYPYMRYLASDVLKWNKNFTKCLGLYIIKGLSQDENM